MGRRRRASDINTRRKRQIMRFNILMWFGIILLFASILIQFMLHELEEIRECSPIEETQEEFPVFDDTDSEWLI